MKLADTFVPAADDLANANLELKWNTTGDGAVEDTTIGELSSVVYFDDSASRYNFSDTLV